MSLHKSRFLRPVSTGAISLCIIGAIVTAPSAHAMESGGDRITFIHRFLSAIYPELHRRQLQMEIEEQDRFGTPTYVSGKHLSTFVVTLAPAPPCGVQQARRKGSAHQDRPAGTATARAINTFTGVFQFSDGKLTNYYSGSALVNWDRLAAVMRLVDAHAEWSDAQVLRALARAGAKYTPDKRNEFIDAIPKTELRKLFGPLRITSVQFLLRDQAQLKAGLQAAEMYWQIDATRGQKHFKFDFEPFGGKLFRALILGEGQASAVQRERPLRRSPAPAHTTDIVPTP